MAIEREKFPIVLTIIENFGLSSSWNGNAVASANPVNFYSMWEKNPHTLLYPDKKDNSLLYENSDIDLIRLFSGREVSSDKEFLDTAVKNNQFLENQTLDILLKESEERNSAVHLVGNLPGTNDSHADLNHLFSLIETIKTRKIFRVYLHLIVDDNLKDQTEIIDDFLSKIYKIGSCEIASVIGIKYLYDENNSSRDFTKGVNTIISGEGDRALTPEQALSFRGLNNISEKKPTSVLFNNRFAYKISNFDTVIFFNHNNKTFSKLALLLVTGSGSHGRTNFPKFLKIVSMLDFIDQGLDQLQVLFNRDYSDTLTQSLFSANIDQLFLSDTSRVATIDKHLKGRISGSGGTISQSFIPIIKDSNPGYYEQVLDLMLKQLSFHLEQKKSRFITLIIPVLSMEAVSNFAQTIGIIKLLDKFLPKLEAEVTKNNGLLILTSDHGGIEKMSERNAFELINSKTINPVPLIFSIPGYKGSSESKIEAVPNRMLYDMIKKSHYISDFAPTVLELAHAKAPDVMTGKSFLSELRVEIKDEPRRGPFGASKN